MLEHCGGAAEDEIDVAADRAVSEPGAAPFLHIEGVLVALDRAVAHRNAIRPAHDRERYCLSAATGVGDPVLQVVEAIADGEPRQGYARCRDGKGGRTARSPFLARRIKQAGCCAEADYRLRPFAFQMEIRDVEAEFLLIFTALDQNPRRTSEPADDMQCLAKRRYGAGPTGLADDRIRAARRGACGYGYCGRQRHCKKRTPVDTAEWIR